MNSEPNPHSETMKGENVGGQSRPQMDIETLNDDKKFNPKHINSEGKPAQDIHATAKLQLFLGTYQT